MTEHLADLERLQRLREVGALTDAEFEVEKAKLLSVSGKPRMRAGPGRAIWYWIVGGIAILLAGGSSVAWWLRQSEPEAITVAASGNRLVPSGGLLQAQSLDIRNRPAPEQLTAAFRAAFGVDRRARLRVGDQSYVFRPAMLEWLNGKAALISLGQNVEDYHVSSGTMAVHYLEPAGEGFRVTGNWPNVVDTGTFGAAPQRVSINHSLSQYPVVYSEGGGTWQGYTCTWAYLVELGPDRPVASGPIALSYSNGGAVLPENEMTTGGDEPRAINGRLGNVRRGSGFDVIFTGTERFREHYSYRGNRFLRDTPESRATC